jgi:hypothetical protein
MAATMADQDLLRLTGDEQTALVALLKRVVDEDRYPSSPRICTLQGILAKLEGPETGTGTSVPPLRHYAPPRAKAAQQRAR